MSEWSCCGAYNKHAKTCVWNEQGENYFPKVKAERDRYKEALESTRSIIEDADIMANAIEGKDQENMMRAVEHYRTIRLAQSALVQKEKK